MHGLAGKRALVSGAARGIGRAVAERLLDEGASVALVDVDGDALGRAEGQLRGGGGRLVAVRADVADEAAVRDAVAEATAAFGGLDVVVPNAAVQLVGADDRADRLDADVWRRTLEVNFTGAFFTAKHGAAALLAGGGCVVFVASPAGTHGIAETPMNAWWTGDPKRRAQVLAPVPLGRAAAPSEIAAVVAFLASDDASYVTGALWPVDGGLTAV